MTNIPASPDTERAGDFARHDGFTARTEALRARVGAAAKALAERGLRPTVTRIRAALGGGSPNELAPALKYWKELVPPTLGAQLEGRGAVATAPPTQIARLTYELWQRALAAAVIELKGGASARQVVVRSEEVNSLRNQVSGLRDQLQRESLAYGELRAQAARHETMARQALASHHESQGRERQLLRALGEARERIVQLEAAAATVRPPPRKGAASSRLRRQDRARAWGDLSRAARTRKSKGKGGPRKKAAKRVSVRVSATRKTRPTVRRRTRSGF
jgi:hypothetical protein